MKMEIIALVLNVVLLCFSTYLIIYNCSVVIGSNKAPFQQNWLGLSLSLAGASPIIGYICPPSSRSDFIVHFACLSMAYVNLYVTRFNRSIKKQYLKSYVATTNAFIVLIIFYMLTEYYRNIQPDTIFSSMCPFFEGLIKYKLFILIIAYLIFVCYNTISIILDVKLVKYQITILKLQTSVCTTILFVGFIMNSNFINNVFLAIMLLITELCIFSIVVPIKGRFYKYDV